MSFKAIDNRLLKKYIKIWEGVSRLINIKVESEPVYRNNDKYIKKKIKSYGDKVNTDFQGKKVPKENVSYKCFSLIVFESVKSIILKYFWKNANT